MKIRRKISSIPQRSADETWNLIIDLITGPGSIDTKQLEDARGVMTSLITDELYDDEPIIIVGHSHRLVIYLLYGLDSIESEDDIDSIDWNPTSDDWTIYVPCDEGNIDWVKKSFKQNTSRFIAHKIGESLEKETDSKNNSKNSESLKIDWEAI